MITGLSNGGAEGVLYRLCKYDKACTHLVVSLTDEGKYGPLLGKENIQVICLNMKPGRVSISGLIKLFFLLRKEKADIVQTWMYHADLIGGIIAKLSGCKSIFWNVRHSTLEPGKSKRLTIWIAKACAFISNWVPKKIVYCASNAKKIHCLLGYKAEKSVVIGNGYDLNLFNNNYFSREGFRKEFNFMEETFVIGMIGRYNIQKDHLNLISSLSLVKSAGYSFKAVLVGNNIDEANDELINEVNRHYLADSIFYLGPRGDIPCVMNGLDINVLSSSFGEAFPNVLAESMACGTPCVTTDVGDAALIVGTTGWVVPIKNSKLLAEAIIQAIDEWREKKRAWQLRKNACRQRAADLFKVETMIERYHNCWFKK